MAWTIKNTKLLFFSKTSSLPYKRIYIQNIADLKSSDRLCRFGDSIESQKIHYFIEKVRILNPTLIFFNVSNTITSSLLHYHIWLSTIAFVGYISLHILCLCLSIGIAKGIGEWDDEHCYYYAMEHCEAELFDYISKHHQSARYRQFVEGEARKPQVAVKVAAKLSAAVSE